MYDIILRETDGKVKKACHTYDSQLLQKCSRTSERASERKCMPNNRENLKDMWNAGGLLVKKCSYV